MITPTPHPKSGSKSSVADDAYFTKPEVAEACISTLRSWGVMNNIPFEHYRFLEPSAGACAFYDKLPNCYGLDIKPRCMGIEEADFLSWSPPNIGDSRWFAVGNPPFGYRGAMIYAFLEHLSKMDCDYVAFIVPISFAGENAKKKLLSKGWQVVNEVVLPEEAFQTPDGESKSIPCVFQIYEKCERQKLPEPEVPCEIYRYATYDKVQRGIEKHKQIGADFYLVQALYKIDYDTQLLYEFLPTELQTNSVWNAIKIPYDYPRRRELYEFILATDWSYMYQPKTNGGVYLDIPTMKRVISYAGFVKTAPQETFHLSLGQNDIDQ